MRLIHIELSAFKTHIDYKLIQIILFMEDIISLYFTRVNQESN